MRFLSAGLFLAAAALVAPSAMAADRVVNVYNWSDYVGEGVLDDFTKATGIKVVYDVYDSMEVLETKILAGGSGYDVIVPTDRNLARLIQAGVISKLDTSKIPNVVSPVRNAYQVTVPGSAAATARACLRNSARSSPLPGRASSSASTPSVSSVVMDRWCRRALVSHLAA